jgi:hypothetical protein
MRLSVNGRFGLRKSFGDVADFGSLEPIKLRIKVIWEPLLWRWVSDVVPGVLGSYLDSGVGDFSVDSLRRRPKKKNHSPAAAKAPTPNKQPITIPAMAPPLNEDDLWPVVAEASDVWAGSELPTVTVTGCPAIV